MKYMGNKARIADEILAVMLQGENRGLPFIDMFCGSCSVTERISPNIRRFANDKNKYLIAMWKSLVEGKEMPQTIEKDFYSDVRDCYNGKNDKYSDDIIGWVGYMGSFDGGYSGHNVMGTNGKARNYIQENINNTLKQVDKLKDVVFSAHSYDEYPLTEKSLIYCDIPYRDTKQYHISRNFDYEKFYDWVRAKKAEGHIVYVSEYNMPPDFQCVWSKEITNAMNQTITKKPVEKLFL